MKQIQIKQWGPFLFANLNNSLSFTSFISPLEALLNKYNCTLFSNYSFHTQRVYKFDCNWKVFIENYLDGGYHIPYVHPSLANELDMSSYTIEDHSYFSIQTCLMKSPAESTPTFVPNERSLYIYIFPNTTINKYGPILDCMRIVPQGVDKTIVYFDYFVDNNSNFSSTEVSAMIEAGDKIQREDINSKLQSKFFIIV